MACTWFCPQWLHRLSLPLVLAAVLGCAMAMGAAPASGQDAERAVEARLYQLGAGDRLRVTVFRHPDLSGEFEIDGSGQVALPLVGGVKLGGLTLAQAAEAIVAALKPDYLINPRISLEVLNYRPFYIIGEIRAPGSYSFVNGITVLNAVAIAGGFTYRARENRMTIIRAGDPEREKTQATPDTVVLPGDVIEIPQRFF